MIKYDLGWGNSVAVREAFLKTYNQAPVLLDRKALARFDYPAHEGDKALISITADVIKRQYGLTYKHIFIVSGATGGCVISMRAYEQAGYEYCLTRPAPYYVRYPKMIQASGLKHVTSTFGLVNQKMVAMVDIPSNPLGLFETVVTVPIPVILDAVYLNNVYMPPILVQTIPHDVLVGSYSKLLGINGVRLGWIATNDDLLAVRIGELVTSEYCGMSTASQDILKSSLPDLAWELFESYARYKLDMNREKWSQLEAYFGDQPVKQVGMFYYAPVDEACAKLLDKAGINWTRGSVMGTDDSFGRFNIGQNNRVVEEAVKAILKADHV